LANWGGEQISEPTVGCQRSEGQSVTAAVVRTLFKIAFDLGHSLQQVFGGKFPGLIRAFVAQDRWWGHW
jgi:hypothetical protein